MGNTTSHNIIKHVNYNCPTCMKTNKLPNIAGKFHIINDTDCQCNGCQTIYPKEQIFKQLDRDVLVT